MRCTRLAVAGLAGLLGATPYALAEKVPSLGQAGSFAVLAGAAVRNSGPTTVTGNLGVSPGSTVTGSPVVKIGKKLQNDAIAQRAQKDLASAYADIVSRPCRVHLTDFPTVLPPNVYCLSSPPALSGPLTLDADGDPDAVWIFQIAGAFATAATASVSVVTGGLHDRVFWQVEQSATLGRGTLFAGNILARDNITLGSDTLMSGRALAKTGTVTLERNSVSICCGDAEIQPPILPSGAVGGPEPG